MDSIQINFKFNKEDEPDDSEVQKRRKFWDSLDTFQWFQDRGYSLYERVLYNDDEPLCRTAPRLPSEELQDAPFPYASHYGRISRVGAPPLCVDEIRGTVAFAQDTLNRHVAIKIVPDGTDEYRILRFLSEQDHDVLRENCIIPVLELLPVQGFWFAVMPRWGGGIVSPTLDKAYEALDIIHSLLKALVFLHQHNIYHGDIKLANVLVNQFASAGVYQENTPRKELRAKKRLSYALFDFDLALMLPPEVERSTYRLPYQRSWGTFNMTMDTAQGEFDFNPFVLDVGMLGAVLCQEFQHLCPQIPFLAPLLDKMTTRFLHNRFSAAEALQFFETMYSQLTDAELNQEITCDYTADTGYYWEYDRWASLPADLAKRWAGFREPPIPWTIKLLRRLCERTWALHAVAYVRWFSFRATTLFRSVFRRLWLRSY